MTILFECIYLKIVFQAIGRVCFMTANRLGPYTARVWTDDHFLASHKLAQNRSDRQRLQLESSLEAASRCYEVCVPSDAVITVMEQQLGLGGQSVAPNFITEYFASIHFYQCKNMVQHQGFAWFLFHEKCENSGLTSVDCAPVLNLTRMTLSLASSFSCAASACWCPLSTGNRCRGRTLGCRSACNQPRVHISEVN